MEDTKMEEEKKISMKIESNVLGHETVCVPMSQAINRIETETSENGKWLYCDGRYTATDTATSEGKARLMETLDKASDVTLAGTLLGG